VGGVADRPARRAHRDDVVRGAALGLEPRAEPGDADAEAELQHEQERSDRGDDEQRDADADADRDPGRDEGDGALPDEHDVQGEQHRHQRRTPERRADRASGPLHPTHGGQPMPRTLPRPTVRPRADTTFASAARMPAT
jgi:hypothetical protein